MTALFKEIASVTTPYTLAAFVVAALVFLTTKICDVRTKRDLELVRMTRPQERLKTIKILSEKYSLGNVDERSVDGRVSEIEHVVATRERRLASILRYASVTTIVLAISSMIFIATNNILQRFPTVQEAALEELERDWRNGTVAKARKAENAFWDKAERRQRLRKLQKHVKAGKESATKKLQKYINEEITMAGSDGYRKNLLVVVNFLSDVSDKYLEGKIPPKQACAKFAEPAFDYQRSAGRYLRRKELEQGRAEYWTPLNRLARTCCDRVPYNWSFCS